MLFSIDLQTKTETPSCSNINAFFYNIFLGEKLQVWPIFLCLCVRYGRARSCWCLTEIITRYRCWDIKRGRGTSGDPFFGVVGGPCLRDDGAQDLGCVWPVGAAPFARTMHLTVVRSDSSMSLPPAALSNPQADWAHRTRGGPATAAAALKSRFHIQRR